MKVLPLKNLLLSNASLKIISLFFGYSFWYIASIHQPILFTTCVPLCFITTHNSYSLKAPEYVTVTLEGKRLDLYMLDASSLCAHTDISHLSPGTHAIILNEKNLFLPHSIKLLHYKPSNLTVTLEKNKE